MAEESSFGLVQRAKAGDLSALDQLMLRYLPRLRRWTRRRLPAWARDLAETEDSVQETLLNAVRNLPGFEMRHDLSLVFTAQPLLLGLRPAQILFELLDAPRLVVNDPLRITRRGLIALRHAPVMPVSRAQYKQKLRINPTDPLT